MRTAIYSDIDSLGISQRNLPISLDDLEDEQTLIKEKEYKNLLTADRDRGLQKPLEIGGYKQPEFEIEGDDLYKILIGEYDGKEDEVFNLGVFGDAKYLSRVKNNILPMSSDQAMKILREAEKQTMAQGVQPFELVDDPESGMSPYLRVAVQKGLDEDESMGSDLFSETSREPKTGAMAILSGNKAFTAEDKLFKSEGRLKLEAKAREGKVEQQKPIDEMLSALGAKSTATKPRHSKKQAGDGTQQGADGTTPKPPEPVQAGREQPPPEPEKPKPAEQPKQSFWRTFVGSGRDGGYDSGYPRDEVVDRPLTVNEEIYRLGVQRGIVQNMMRKSKSMSRIKQLTEDYNEINNRIGELGGKKKPEMVFVATADPTGKHRGVFKRPKDMLKSLGNIATETLNVDDIRHKKRLGKNVRVLRGDEL